MQDKTLFFLVATIAIISVLSAYSLSAYATLHFGYSQFHFFLRQLLSVSIALFFLWFLAAKVPTEYSTKFGLALFSISFFLMIAMAFMPSSLVSAVGGAKRWIKLPGFSLSPVEFFKIGFIFFLAWSFSRKIQNDSKVNLQKEFLSILPYLFLFLIAALFIAIFQNDIGQVMVLGLTFGLMLFFAGRSFKLFAILIGVAIGLFVIFVSISENRVARIKMWWASAQKFILSYLPPSLAQELKIDNVKESYQIINSLHAMHHGGFLGQGLGNGQIKLGFLSDVHTDFVLAGLTEELGFIGVATIIALYLFILHRLFRIANRTKDRTTYLYSIGLASLIGFSLLINAYGISSLIPVKGIAVPMLSYGGSSMIANAIGVGLLLLLMKKAKSEQQ